MNNKSTNKNKYDVISISHFFYPRVGGLETMAYGVIKYLSQRGLRSIAVYGNDRNLKTKAEGFDWVSFKCFKIFNNTYPILGLRFTLYIFKLIKRNPDAVVLVYDRHLTSSFIASLVCKLLRHKYILVAQTTTSNYFNKKIFELIANTLDKTVFKWVLNGAERIISVSESNKNFLIQNFHSNPEKITVIYNVFNEELVKKFEVKEKEKTVVFATKFIPVKDPDTTAKAFLKMAQNYPDWRFVFAGKGQSIMQDIEELPENIDFIPRFLPQLDLFNLLSKSAIYINSSLNEGLSLGIVEAASLGNICVLSDAPSNIEVAKNLDLEEFVFKREDSEDLAFKIELAINQFEKDKKRNLHKQISEKAFNKFSSEKILDKYFNLIQNFNLIYNESEDKELNSSLKLRVINE